jgi:hypothetical protein
LHGSIGVELQLIMLYRTEYGKKDRGMFPMFVQSIHLLRSWLISFAVALTFPSKLSKLKQYGKCDTDRQIE